MTAWKDDSLASDEGRRKVERGLAGGQWRQTPIPRKEMLALMQRSDGALRDPPAAATAQPCNMASPQAAE